MSNLRGFRAALSAIARPMAITLALGALPLGAAVDAQAQDRPAQRRIVPHARAVGPVAGRVLTVHRRAPRFATARRGGGFYESGYDAGGYYVPSPLRRWNDPNLDSFGGWRLGGDNFYGDGAGDTITRGNATLGAISGYGGARGGYGGPHFDSVGGFHNGPGPDAGEASAYASGTISTPDYGGIVPRYPSVKARVAALTMGVVPNAGSKFVRVGLNAASRQPSAVTRGEPTPYLRSDDLLPDLGLDEF